MTISYNIGTLTVAAADVTLSGLYAGSGALPAGAYLSCALSKASLFGASGLQYTVARDASNVIASTAVPGGQAAQAHVTAALSSMTWVLPSGAATLLAAGYTTEAGATRSVTLSPFLLQAAANGGSAATFGQHAVAALACLVRQQPKPVPAATGVFTAAAALATSLLAPLGTAMQAALSAPGVVTGLYNMADWYPDTADAASGYVPPASLPATNFVCYASAGISFTLHGKARTVTWNAIPLVLSLA